MSHVATELPHLMTDEELVQITRYTQPSRQLEFLHQRGFYRAALHRGQVYLERAHYQAVCQGMDAANEPKPRVRLLHKQRDK